MFKATAVAAMVLAAGLATAACSSDSITGASAASLSSGSGATNPAAGQPSGTFQVRISCELRQQRSKVSVDGNNLRPLGGLFSARVRSGANGANAPQQTAVGDEAEFDFDSEGDDIAAGATPIAPDFIQIGAGADVTAEILNAGGVVVATGSADCMVR